jgi:hypothetical protein
MYRIIGADGREYGPISADQVRQWVAEGRAIATTRILTEGSTEWKLLGSLPEFSMLFTAGAPTGAPAVFPAEPIPSQRTNGMATAGLIMGLASLIGIPFSLFCCCLGLPFNVLGIIFSLVGLSQIRNNPQLYTGRGLAIAGLLLSTLCLLFYVAWIIFMMIFGHWQEGLQHHGQRL